MSDPEAQPPVDTEEPVVPENGPEDEDRTTKPYVPLVSDDEDPEPKKVKKVRRIPTSLLKFKRSEGEYIDLMNRRVDAVFERFPEMPWVTDDNVLQSRHKIAKELHVPPTPRWLSVLHVAGLRYKQKLEKETAETETPSEGSTE